MKMLVVIFLIFLFINGQCQVKFIERAPQLTAVFEANPDSLKHRLSSAIFENQPSGSDEESAESSEMFVQQHQQNSEKEINNMMMEKHFTNQIEPPLNAAESPDTPIVITYVEQEILISPKTLSRLIDSFLERPAVHFLRRSDVSDLQGVNFNAVPDSSKEQYNNDAYNLLKDYFAKFMNSDSLPDINLKTPLSQINAEPVVILENNLKKKSTENEQTAADLVSTTMADIVNEIGNRDSKYIFELLNAKPNENLHANDHAMANEVENEQAESGIEETTEAPLKMKSNNLFRENQRLILPTSNKTS